MEELSKSFELARQYLNQEVNVIIDRPLGSKHTEYDFVYDTNYGYIEGIKAPDGEELDAYYLGIQKPIKSAKGICIAIAHRKNDNDDKLIVVPKGVNMSNEQIMSEINFQEKWFNTEIVRQ